MAVDKKLNSVNKKKIFYWLTWIFLWLLRASKLRKVFVQEGHANLTPKWSLHTCTQIVAHEADGLSLHPSTQYL